MAENSASTDKAETDPYFPEKGERAVSVGQTGSGKTLFNRSLLKRLPDAPTIIYDTKHDPKFDHLPKSRVANSYDDIYEALDDLGVDYIIVRPSPMVTASAQMLDSILQHHEANWRGIDAYVDELYHFHSNGRAGPGLSGLYTRGRSRGITFIGSTQRPAWISGFVLSETQLFYLFRLSRLSDRKRINDFIPGFDKLTPAKRFEFYAYRDGGDKEEPELKPPIPVDASEKLGYTDHRSVPEAANSEDETETTERPVNVWF